MVVFCADIGTTSLKAQLINEEGKVIQAERKSYSAADESFLSESWRSSFFEFFLNICKNITPDAICISGNGPTIVSENGRTLLWNEKGGAVKSTSSFFISRLLLFKEKYGEDFEKSSHIFSGPEYLVWCLTGKARTVLPESRFLPAYWTKESLLAAGFTEKEIEKLPEFCPLGEKALLREEIAEKLKIPSSVPVIFGGPDFVMALIGTGTLSPGKICDRSGSSEGINLCSEKPIFASGVRTLPSVVPGLWNISVLIEESGSLLDKFKSEIEELSSRAFSYDEIIDYSYSDKNSEGFFTLKKIDDGVRNAVFLLRKLSEENGLAFDPYMTVTGGQAKNEKYLRRKALDVQTELCVLENPDAELSGDAALAFTSLGVYSSLQETAKKMCRVKKRYSLNETAIPEMKIYKIPEKVSGIIFDIDSTLYTSEAYAIEQVDVQIRCIAEKKGISVRKARNLISEYRRNWKAEHEGRKISLGNTLVHFGISIEESVEMRRNLLEPKNFLSRDERLIQTLEKLSKKYKMICVTNNPVLPARKTLEAIGVSDFFPEIIGLDTCLKSKPAREPFELAVKKLSVPASEIVSVGDRFDMDISLPLEMGMGGILVGGVSDVYELPQILEKKL